MQDRDSYRSVYIERGDLFVRIKNTKQKDWIKVCEKLDLNIYTQYGKGSHVGVYKDNCPVHSTDCCILPIPSTIYPKIHRDMFKKILSYGLESGKYDEADIWRAFGLVK